MNEVFIKLYVLVSLWFWAGMLLSNPLRKAFEDMHWRLIDRIYYATIWQVEKFFERIRNVLSNGLSLLVKRTKLYMEECSYELRVKAARKLVSNELLEELNRKNLVAAIARAKLINCCGGGIPIQDIERFGSLVTGKTLDRETKKEALKAAFELCDTDMFQQIITRMPGAQERILLAFEQIEGDAPYDSVKNEEYRKFIRE